MIRAFLFTGFICMFAQILKDNTNMTNGHITSLFVIIGTILSFFGIYDKIIDKVGGAASVVIMSFGNVLYKSAVKYGLLNMFVGVSLGVTSSILFAFIITMLFRSKS